MKKLIFALSCLAAAAVLCACSSGGLFSKPAATPLPDIDPASLLTIEDVASVAGYTPVIEETATSRTGNVATVMYRSEPIGQNDPVTVKLTQFTEAMGYEQIFAMYEQGKALRRSAELVESLGQEAYIAFPTIHVYDRGCLIEITAGSGADETQKELLKSLATAAAGRLEAIIPEYVEK